MVDEIEMLTKVFNWKKIVFSDDNFCLNKKRAIAISRDIIQRHLEIQWKTGTGVRADSADPEMFSLMKRAGCRRIGFGVESGSPEILKRIKKGETLDDIVRAVKMAHKAGMVVHGSFIIGSQGESISTVKESIKFAKKLIKFGMSSISWNMATPYPGTELWQYVMENGKLLTHNYDDYVQRIEKATFETPYFSAQDRQKAWQSAKKTTEIYFKWVLIISILKNPGRVWQGLKRRFKRGL